MNIKLTELKVGEKARVLKINGGLELKNKLQVMGVFPKVEITIIQSLEKSPIIIEVGNTRLAIGKSMAEKIEVVKNE